MKKLFKKRQLILATLVLALGAAVFINWYYTKPTVAADGTVITTAVAAVTNKASGSQNIGSKDSGENLGDSQYVNNPYNTKSTEYYAGAKLKREAAHAEAKDTFNDVITDNKSDKAAVAQATKDLAALSNAIKTESDCESLITAKTGSECLVTIDAGSAQAVLGGDSIDSATALQIKEILMNKTGLPAEKITIVELKG
jgi:stage III sporulation protein AH